MLDLGMSITRSIIGPQSEFNPTSVKLVQSAGDLAGPLDSTVLYQIDGQIDMGLQQVIVPQGGLHLNGYGTDISRLYSTEDNYTMFIDDGVFSGNFFKSSMTITTSGASSKVQDLDNAGNFGVYVCKSVNFDDSTSRGDLRNYRQGDEFDTGYFGGSPALTLHGPWVGGYIINLSIVRGLDSGFSGALFQAGVAFTMQSRFKTNANIDIPSGASFVDFSATNFPNASTLQIQGAIVERDGVSDPTDTNYTPNINSTELPCDWSDNVGFPDTHIGGTLTLTSEVETVISTQNVFTDLLGMFVESDLQHYDHPSTGQLRHLASSPQDFTVKANIEVTGGNNNLIELKVVKWDDSASAFVDVFTQHRELVGSSKLGEFFVDVDVKLDVNDYIKLQVANTSSTANVTASDGSMLKIIAR